MDIGWLERCQVFTEVKDEHKPVVGNLDLPEIDRIVQSSSRNEKVVVENSMSRVSASPDDKSQVCSEKSPVHVDHRSGNSDGETKVDNVTESQGGIDQSSPPLETRKQPKKRRSRKAQDSGVTDSEQKTEQKTVRKKGRKRQRETEEGEEQAGQTESVQKKRRTKKEVSADEKPVKKELKKKAKGSEEEESTCKTKVPQKSKIPQENLLGEVDEEDVRAASSRKQNPVRSRSVSVKPVY